MTPPRLQLVVACLALLAGSAVADVINVPSDYPTIQGAVDASSDGDEIIVAPGTYINHLETPVVDMLGKAITLRASGSPEETIIDGLNSTRGVSCWADETATTVIEGFTIRNCFGKYGGGIYCYHSSPTIINCRITACQAQRGGGIDCYGSSPTISGCTISGNSADRGGGIDCYNNSSPNIVNCTITNNMSQGLAGGIYFIGGSPTVSGCTISGNTADDTGGGLFSNGGTPTITNCTISGNTAGDTGGGFYCFHNFPTVIDCTISGNTAGNTGGGISCSDGLPTLSGTLVCGNDPDQVFGAWTDDGGNEILEDCPVFQGACCTNGGCIIGPEEDCIAYLGTWLGKGTSCDDVTCPATCPGDADGDGEVGVNDILIVISEYGVTCP